MNAGIVLDNFPTVWGNFNSTAALILSLPNGCVAAKFDVLAAYRITPMRILQQFALCIAWQGSVYLDRAAPFGLQSSAGVFGSIANMLVAIYNVLGFGPIQKWVHNFFVI
jgi:hypothetical protein